MSSTLKLVVAIIVLVPSAAVAVENDGKHAEAEKKAVAAAAAWLAQVDQDQYAESWESAAAYFKNAVAKDAWLKSISAVRKPLGKLKSRQLKSQDYRTSLPGAPDGQYVIIQFDTSFDNKKSAVETVTPMLDKDGTWRVSGYFVK
jgi:hypothetical protein